jgi:hypothetical protein
VVKIKEIECENGEKKEEAIALSNCWLMAAGSLKAGFVTRGKARDQNTSIIAILIINLFHSSSHCILLYIFVLSV